MKLGALLVPEIVFDLAVRKITADDTLFTPNPYPLDGRLVAYLIEDPTFLIRVTGPRSPTSSRNGHRIFGPTFVMTRLRQWMKLLRALIMQMP